MAVVTMVFFFSSRRRHTRYWRDWSSDVCSSDLDCTRDRHARRRVPAIGCQRRKVADADALRRVRSRLRSEERRVGKECRTRWSRYREKRKRIEIRAMMMRNDRLTLRGTTAQDAE